MKPISIISVFLLCSCIAVPQLEAQRCLPGQRGLQFTAGTVNGFNHDVNSPVFKFHTGMAFSQYVKNADRWQLGVDYLEKGFLYQSGKSIPQAQFTADAGYFKNILSDVKKTFFASIGASVVGGYETINWNNKVLPDGATINDKDGFLYGGALTLQAEAYLSNRIVFLANVRERFLTGSAVGKLNTLFSIGFKISIN